MRLRRNRILLSALLALGLCSAAGAQEKHPLWKVTSGETSLHMLGSIHLMKKDNYPLPDVIDKAFEESDTAVFEVDLKEMVSAEKQQYLMMKAFLPPGQSLEGQLSKETYTRLKKKAGEMGMDLALFARVKPWFIAINLSLKKMMSLGFMPHYGVDRHYYNRAVKAGKKVVGLETTEFQLDVFDKLSPQDQDKLLLQILEDLDVIEKELDKIVKGWSTGNSKTIEETLLKSFKDHPEIYETFLTKRNKDWLVKMEGFLKEKKKYFVVVGVAHLVGKDSLVAMLKKKGYKVEQL